MSQAIRFGSQFSAATTLERAQKIRKDTSAVLDGRMHRFDFSKKYGFLPKAIHRGGNRAKSD